jgi:hypothetical protein
MHFLLMVLRLLLDRLFSLGGDNVTLAARSDGRIEHVPTRPGCWDRWLRFIEEFSCRMARGALEVRAVDSKPLVRQHSSNRWTEQPLDRAAVGQGRVGNGRGREI